MTQAATARVSSQNFVVLAMLRLLAIPLAAVLGIGISAAFGLEANRIPLLAATTMLVTLVVGFIAVDRMRPLEQRNLLLVIFSCSFLVLFVVPVFVFYVGHTGYLPEAISNPVPLSPGAVTRGVIAATVGYASLLAGNLLPVGAAIARNVPQMKREWSFETCMFIALTIIPIGWAVRLLNEFGFIPERAGSGVLGAIWAFTEFGIALLLLCYQRYKSRAALMLMGVLLVPTMIVGFAGGTKSAVLRPLVMIAIVHIVATRRLRVWWIVGFVALMSVFYPISEVFRGYAWTRGLTAVDILADPARTLRVLSDVGSSSTSTDHMVVGLQQTSNRLNGLGILSVIMRDAGTRVPYQWGWSISYIPMSFVPRIVWPGKPKFMTGQWVTDNFGGGPHVSSSTGATWIGELYYNFSWPGIVIGMMILGVWFRFLQECFLGVNATIPCVFAGVITIVSLCTALDGDLIAATNSVVFNVAPIVVLHIAVVMLTPPPRHPPPLPA